MHPHLVAWLRLTPHTRAGLVVLVQGIVVKEQMPMKVGAKVWHDRNYVFTSIPSYLQGADFLQQPHKSVRKGSRISVRVNGDATIFVIVENGGRDGGMVQRLPRMGWKLRPGVLHISGYWLADQIKIYSLDVGSSSVVTLPPTTTGQTVMCIAVVG